MAFPTAATSTNCDASTDDPKQALLTDLYQLIQKFNQLLGVAAPLDSPALINTPTAPTQAATDASTKLATTAQVQNAIIQAGSTIPANLLFNGSAEFYADGWTLPVQAGYQSGGFGEGSYFNILSATLGTYVAESAKYPIGAGMTITLQAEMFASGLTAGKLAMDIGFYNASNVLISYGNARSELAANGGWINKSNSVTTPANTAYFTVRFFMESAVLTNGAIRKMKVGAGATASIYTREADFIAMKQGTLAPIFGFTSVLAGTAAGHAVNYSQVLGIGQTRKDVTASRALATNYTNSTGKPILVIGGATSLSTSGYMSLTVAGNMVSSAVSATLFYPLRVWGIVLPGETYQYNSTGTLSTPIYMELS
jgi:hypothetical protein